MPETADAVDASLTTENQTLISRPLAGPWPRYWARTFDIILLSFIAGIGVYWVLPAVFGWQAILDPAYDTLIALALFPVVMVLDAVIQAAFGNTLGKLIAGIRVETTQGNRPSLSQSVQRNLRVWIKGFAFGIPLVSLFSLMACYTTVKHGGLTSWDEHSSTRVFNKNSNIYRTLLAFGAVLVMAAGIAALNVMSSQAMDGQTSDAEVAKLAESLPRQVDAVTRWDSIEMIGGVVTSTYSLVDEHGAPSLTPMQLRQLMSGLARRVAIGNYCHPDTAGPQTPPSYSVHYRYRTFDGQVAAEFTLNPEDCTRITP